MDNQNNDDEVITDTPPSETTATVQQSDGEDACEGSLTDAVKEIASMGRILDWFQTALVSCGVVGEEKVAQLVYLALTSRFLERPISLAVKGPSSGGKSHVTSQVLRFFPGSAFYALTAMSDKALAYSEEDLRHRFLVLFEAESLKSDMANYLMRSLLSEGRIRYETVVSSNTGLNAQLIEREGPTGLLVTTAATNLHPENETRMLSVTVQDTKAQTKAIVCSMASDESPEEDLSAWIELQEWLSTAEHRVKIPFAKKLAELSNPAGVRFRRDFRLLLNLIETHAILHQLNRERDDAGQIIANSDDYEVVHDLVAEIISEGLGATVSDAVRETVNVVGQNLLPGDMEAEPMSLTEVKDKLGVDKSSASRRVKQAIKLGYLSNEELIKGKPMRLYIGEPLPEEIQVLPRPEELGFKGKKDVTAAWN